ncbi:MAG: PQQ-binding-like beta-propeller repeat protein, partial [Caulobacterales bacterium]|nr:PQQ-binding-like beta-propeller repeat protein [Caulobacterales bacterium]
MTRTPRPLLLARAAAALMLACIYGPGARAEPAPTAPPFDPAAAFDENCATCHLGGYPKAPHMITFQIIGSDAIYDSVSTGLMSAYARDLGDAERRALADFLGGTSAPDIPPLTCAGPGDLAIADAGPFQGWSLTLEGTRFVDAATAGLDKTNVADLALKWAFAYPGATRARSQPSYADGVAFVGSQSGRVYALDLETGCAHWTFDADAEVRSAVSLAADRDRPLALFGDIKGAVYAVDLSSGAPVWRAQASDHPAVTLTGSPRLYQDRLYVPLSSTEWASAADPSYPCCTFRGGVVAIDVDTGAIDWTTYAIPEAPAPTGDANSAGAPRHHPSGAPIWNSPTIDEKRGVLYVGTGEGYTSPAADTTDAILAIDLEDGALIWSFQATAGDAWNMACFIGDGPNCPEENGPDLDFGAPPMLLTLPDGRDILVAGQKSADIYALDPDDGGALIWRRKIGRGGFAGGVHWGLAANAEAVFAPNADTTFIDRFDGEPKPGLFALDPATGETLWFAPAPDTCADADKPACDPGLSAAVTATPDLVFAGAYDGHVRAHDAATGAILWDVDTNTSFETVSGEIARGGSI